MILNNSKQSPRHAWFASTSAMFCQRLARALIFVDLWQILGLLGNLLSIRDLGETEDEFRGIPRIPRAPGFFPRNRGNVLNKAQVAKSRLSRPKEKEFHRVSYTLQSLGCLTDP